METIDAYLARKHQELKLLNGCLRRPHALPMPRTVGEVIRQKFQLAAALKAEHALNDWTATETAWADADDHRAGPFAFAYDYQRADLEVRGPSFYAAGNDIADTLYTISGMAAIAALLLATRPVLGEADLLMLPGSYGETQELVEAHARHLHPLALTRDLADALAQRSSKARLLLLDSSTTAARFEAVLRCRRPALDLLIFDTTCFANGSGRIRRVLAWARRSRVPVVMVRSHTKLDSLGAEYGRLGSVAFVDWTHVPEALAALPEQTRNAVRLLGGAALPAHFPPYVGTRDYRALTARRMAAILRNSRRARYRFAAALRGLTAELDYAHGLYVTLASRTPLDETTARQAAAAMSDDLRRDGLPIRHAGSFGFDFAATEWFHDATTDCYSVRVAVPDLPTAMWDELTDAIAGWWRAHQGRSAAA
ncbi:conserved protein of unknown function [Bradyrhizobium sp. ORS 285]|uniref:hypothetical protein n=1 Tax=Bradyrhizobium sp. ORS 285 TaxID=115808 RepID=UPI0002E6E9FA|nr:hypothetical protein [Bradyrhizobium sp. ORS 285]SMX61387.1 conserved protein of unknown function [Bradyrhizobium sp. ORS 285]